MATIRQAGALLLVTGVGLAIWSAADRESDDRHEVSAKISEVRLESPDADITIRAGDVDRTTVEEKRSYWLLKRGDAYEVDGETLKLDGDCGWHCRADFVVTVPRGTKVTGEHGRGDLSVSGVSGVDASGRSGDIELRDIDGDVKLRLSSGDVSVDRVSGRLDVEASSGDLEATRLKGGPVSVRAMSGDLEIELDGPVDLTAQGTSGDVEVTAPSGTYDIETSTRSGEVTNGLSDTPGAEHTLEATTVSGDVELVAR